MSNSDNPRAQFTGGSGRDTGWACASRAARPRARAHWSLAEAAAASHGLDGFGEGPLTFLVPRSMRRRRTIGELLSTSHLGPLDRCVVDGLPTTSATLTVIQLIGRADVRQLANAFDSAMRKRLTAPAVWRRGRAYASLVHRCRLWMMTLRGQSVGSGTFSSKSRPIGPKNVHVVSGLHRCRRDVATTSALDLLSNHGTRYRPATDASAAAYWLAFSASLPAEGAHADTNAFGSYEAR
jgi:hypothetical protein